MRSQHITNRTGDIEHFRSAHPHANGRAATIGLLAGDLLLTKPAIPLDWFSRLTVRAQSRMFPEPHASLTHAALYAGDSLVIEAQFDKSLPGRVGVITTPLQDFVSGYAEIRVRRDERLTAVQREQIVARARRHVGRGYSLLRAGQLFLGMMLHDRRSNVTGSRYCPQTPGRLIWGMVCSDVFAVAYGEVTLRAAAPQARYLVSPAALSASENFVDVGTL